MRQAVDEVQALHDAVMGFRHDPLGYVLFAFPWGAKGTVLEHEKGPEPWQRDLLERLGKGLVTPAEAVREAIASGHGIGKAEHVDEPVLTPTGWRRIGDMAVGDLVATVDGTFTRITGVFPQGRRPLYRVMLDDGCSVLADAEHRWLTSTRSERKRGRPGSVRTTAEIAASLTFPNGARDGLNHRLPRLEPIQHPEATVPLDPYLLGCWLGDGCESVLTGPATKREPQLAAAMAAGVEVSAIPDKPEKIGGIRLLGIKPALVALGLVGVRSWEKFIPRPYLHGSIAQRSAVLQGLLDTDGTTSNGNLSYTTTSKRLADGVAELVRSLGGVARMTGCRRPRYRGADGETLEGRQAWTLSLALPNEIAPFRNGAKAERWRPADHPNRARTLERFIQSVEPAGEGEAVCIAVEHPSRLFVTRDHIVTHNSALVSWIIMWAMSTYPDARGVVTANTEGQLRTKTWPELTKWWALAINKAWFACTATALYSALRGHDRTWRVDAITWSENNTEAIAGLHNKGKRAFAIFDEASAIPDIVWETIEGALTDADTELFWCAFGNPTKNTGRFRECFSGGRFSHRWSNNQIDSRSVSMTNKAQIEQWVNDYGEDSDFIRVRVRGAFPRAGSMQFIGTDIVEAAQKRDAVCNITDPVVLGVDPARFGDDRSVIYIRRGRDGRTWPPVILREVDNMTLAGKVAEIAVEMKADAICVDAGAGGGVIDRLRQLRVPNVYEVGFGEKPQGWTPEGGLPLFNNRAAEMWGRMREWLKGGAIPNTPEMAADLTGREYGYDAKNALQLEKKDDMKKRGLASPDIADALALTFAVPVAARLAGADDRRGSHITEYDPLEA